MAGVKLSMPILDCIAICGLLGQLAVRTCTAAPDDMPYSVKTSNVVIEATVITDQLVGRAPLQSCGNSPLAATLINFEVVQLHVDRVYIGIASDDTLTLVRWLYGNTPPKLARAGTRVLAYGSYSCQQFGNLEGTLAIYDPLLSSFVFDGGGTRKPRLVTSSSLASTLTETARSRNQAHVTSPDVLVEATVDSVTAFADGTVKIVAKQSARLAGEVTVPTILHLWFVGPPGCGANVNPGDRLVLPMTVDMQAPIGFCPEGFRVVGGFVQFFGLPQRSVAALYVGTDGRLLARHSGEDK